MLIDPSTGLATWATWALGVGSHTITAAYTGNANFLSSQAGSIPQDVTQADTPVRLNGKAVRNRRGRIVTVELDAHVLSVSPGSGMPTGPVTFFVGRPKLGSTRLIDGTAVLAVRSGLVLHKGVTVRDTPARNQLARRALAQRWSIARKSYDGRGPAVRRVLHPDSRADREADRASPRLNSGHGIGRWRLRRTRLRRTHSGSRMR